MHLVSILGAAAIAIAAASGCGAGSIADFDEIYSRGADSQIECGISIDDKYNLDHDNLMAGLDRASDDETSLHLYAHDPGRTVQLAQVEDVIAGAYERGLDFVTYRELADGYDNGGSLVLSFDDNSVDSWTAMRPMLDRYGAKVTFFVSRYDQLLTDAKDQLRQLAADGHDIEYHTTHHYYATQYVAEHGLDAWLADEIAPALTAMRADGWDPTIFAYPHGDRDDQTDAALLQQFRMLRGIRAHCPN